MVTTSRIHPPVCIPLARTNSGLQAKIPHRPGYILLHIQRPADLGHPQYGP